MAISEEFTINATGETTGETFRGVFKARARLSHKLMLQQDQMRRDLLGTKGEEADQGAQASARVFAKIWAHLTESPNWWRDSGNGLDLEDEAPVLAVYDQILKIEKAAAEKVKKDGDKAAEALKAEEKK